MVYPVAPVAGVDELLDELVATLSDVDGALVLSPDGLLLGMSNGVDLTFASYLSAASAGLHSLAAAVGRHAGARLVHQAIVEMEHALLVVAPVGPVAILAVMLDGARDFTVVGGQIAEFAVRVERQLGAHPADGDAAGVPRHGSTDAPGQGVADARQPGVPEAQDHRPAEAPRRGAAGGPRHSAAYAEAVPGAAASVRYPAASGMASSS
jgi:predicted regulator of Ras-like GTPase activity (Roadblock/LC7/MglB family)